MGIMVESQKEGDGEAKKFNARYTTIMRGGVIVGYHVIEFYD